MSASCVMVQSTSALRTDIPQLHVTSSTPPKSLSIDAQPEANGHLSRRDTTPRLLYRGALSLPDSHLLLDGLTFTIDLPSDDHQASLKLLESPLPLALESMRGRPSIRFVGVEELAGSQGQKLTCDFDGGVNLHVHQKCILTRQLFERNLCMTQISTITGRTERGIRIRLGDMDNPKISNSNPSVSSGDILVYGRVHPSSTIMQLCVTRIVPFASAPAVPKAVAKLRPPRPDDPTPRKPPVGFSMARIGLGPITKRPLAKSKSLEEADQNGGAESNGARKKARKDADKDAALTATKELGKHSRMGSKSASAVFKIPPLPPVKRDSQKDKGKRKANVLEDDIFEESQVSNVISEQEYRNKMFVKRKTVQHLASSGITKYDPEFKEFFSNVYRGTSFALRIKMKNIPIDVDPGEGAIVDRIVKAHVSMYLGGRGIEISAVS